MKNKKHLAYIHEQDCCLEHSGGCNGPLHAHHLLKPWNGPRGMGLKAGDENCVPLCMGHHTELHMRGNEGQFFSDITGDPEFGKRLAEKLFKDGPASSLIEV